MNNYKFKNYSINYLIFINFKILIFLLIVIVCIDPQGNSLGGQALCLPLEEGRFEPSTVWMCVHLSYQFSYQPKKTKKW